jgi:hypothetical protein
VNLAPVVLFAFNRPEHTAQMLDALSKNELAKESDLIVYLDGPRNPDDSELIERVYQVIAGIKGFRSIVINRKTANAGLASNIVEGVSDVISRYGRVIVLEDDIVTSPKFLKYMNDALEYYASDKRVWHISGFSEIIGINRPDSSFLWRVMHCWGWATWMDRWTNFEKNPQELIDEFTPEMIERFNLDGCQNFWAQVLQNASGEINTWAIFWYATIFKSNGLCLSPFNSYVLNIGLDGSGFNCGLDYMRNTMASLNEFGDFNPPLMQSEDVVAVQMIKKYYKAHTSSFALRVHRALKRRFNLMLKLK